MSFERQVYLLNPKNLSPETIAVTFAKTSRSPESFRDIALELTDEKSAQFHEKWVVGYGHSSVAEHAVLHIALENVSRLAIETIESNRLASYTEKSTRYQKWNPQAFFIPPELNDHRLKPLYIETCQMLFAAYSQALEAIREVIQRDNPRRENENDAAWDRRIRADYVDVARFLLPAASLANVGMTANARVLEHAIQKLLTSPLDEVRQIGMDVKQVAQAEVPTLVRYADRGEYLASTTRAMSLETQHVDAEAKEGSWCRLAHCDPDGENMVMAAALFRCGNASLAACQAYVAGLAAEQRLDLARKLLGDLQTHDVPLRELEYSSYTFEVLMDQGAYFEVKRHRMMTQTAQPLTARLGYAVPGAITRAGFEESYREAMEKAASAYSQLEAWNPDIASYIVPNGFNRRVLMSLNLREAYHFCGLRSAAKAHFSVRRVALRMAAEIFAHHPALSAFIPLPPGETWQGTEAAYFTQTT